MLKRIFDISAAFLGLLLLSPVIFIVAIQVRRKLGSPVFFKQTRPGLNGKPFKMVKFRTMLDATDEQGGSVAKIVKLEHAWRRLDGRNDDGFQVAPFPG